MPSAAIGFCPVHGCQARSRGPCEDHRKAQRQATDARRGSRHERGYGNAWDKLSSRWKALHPLCGMRADSQLHPEHSECTRLGLRNPGAPTNRLATDHIIPREEGGTDDETNLQTLCGRCHSVKTVTEDGGGWREGVASGGRQRLRQKYDEPSKP